jgi:D-sedoheptulose 7-phosphate isomerase
MLPIASRLVESRTMTSSSDAILRLRLQQAQQTYLALGDDFIAVVQQAANLAIDALRGEGGVYLAGNGGSAADAQHWAAELVGRYLLERNPLNVVALTTNSSTYTALVNDYPPEEVFERQVRAHVRSGDLFVAISTSGNSENILRAVSAAKRQGAKVVGVTGKDGGKLRALCDVVFIAPSADTPRIQEAHLLFGHCFCELVELERI